MKADGAKQAELPAASYLTQNNGGRPFSVRVKGGNVVEVFVCPTGTYSDEPEDHSDLLFTFNDVSKVLPGSCQPEEPDWVGNSVLLECSDNKYVFIGHMVFEFVADSKITHLYSEVGNSDVPYPVAISDTEVFMLLEEVVCDRALFGEFNDWLSDAYSFYWDNVKMEQCRKLKSLIHLTEHHEY